MRKVKIITTRFNTTTQQDEEHTFSAYFHQWGTEVIFEDERGPITHTVAIVEKYNGDVVTVNPNDIKFIK